MIQCWRLDSERQTLVLGMQDARLPEVIYWGASLPAGEDVQALFAATRLDVTGGMLDDNPPLSICPEASRSFPGHAGLSLRDAQGALLLPDFQFDAAQDRENGLTLVFQDKALGLRYTADFQMHVQTQMIACKVRLEAAQSVWLDWLAAPVFPAPQWADEMIDFTGRWCGEFQTVTTPWSAGARVRNNRTGRTGHEHFPGLIVPARGANNTSGEAVAFHYGWSGGHGMVAEELADGRRHIQFGHAPQTELEAGTSFETATLYATYSDAGLNGCATAFQRHLRDEVVDWPDATRDRPVHYNCWEAVYFDHSLPELKDIATRAAALGAERFVLDDGWFGRRDDDTTSLGDWWIDARKYPEGLGPLIDHIHAEGMRFGIWFEPEMVNEDSDLFRDHPDWVLGAADQIRGRQQLVLNMALPEVQDYLFTKIADVLSAYDVDYVKWDHNRVLPTPNAAQAYGTYALLDRLRAEFPMTEIESCASGGGRIDFGIMQRTQRVWLSDSNDAHERLKIQHNAALFLPSAVTGSHVGPRHCHTSGRVYDMSFRAWVAAQRHLGFEMDPRELTDEETIELTMVTKWWKDNRRWMQKADILRLDSAVPAVIAEQQLCQSGEQFVVFAAKAGVSDQIAPRPLRLTGLDPEAFYDISLINRDAAHHLSRGNPLLKTHPLRASGAFLMQQGLTLPWSFPDRMWVIKGQRR